MSNPYPSILALVETSHGYGRDIIQGIAQYTLEHGGQLDFECRGFFEPAPSWLQDWRGDGVICRSSSAKTLQILRAKKIPIIDLFSKKNSYDVGTDEKVLGEMAAEYFLARGFDQFATFAPKKAWWGLVRSSEFASALEKRGFSCNVFREGQTTKDPYFLKENRCLDSFYQWLVGLPKPTALLAGTDMYGKRVLNACRVLGISIPEEIAVLGVDNDEWFCQMQSPPLSSVCQDGCRIGYEGAKLLYRLLAGKARPKSPTLLPPTYIMTRQSTDIIAVRDSDMVLAMQYIRKHLDDGPTVEQVTYEVGLSRRTLERRFMKQFGRTVKSEITRLRIERSKELLRNTNLSVASIAKRLNFASMEHFIKTFRLREPLSPSEYRKSIFAFKPSRADENGSRWQVTHDDE